MIDATKLIEEINFIKEQNSILASELNKMTDRALIAEGYLEQAIGFIRWSKQFSPNMEVRDNFNQALSVLAGDPEIPDEKPAEIVNERIILN